MARRDALSAEEMREEHRRLRGATAASYVALAPRPYRSAEETASFAG
jgi:hypothetical protein